MIYNYVCNENLNVVQAMFIDFGLAKDRDGGCYLRCVVFSNFPLFIVSSDKCLFFHLKEMDIALGTSII